MIKSASVVVVVIVVVLLSGRMIVVVVVVVVEVAAVEGAAVWIADKEGMCRWLEVQSIFFLSLSAVVVVAVVVGAVVASCKRNCLSDSILNQVLVTQVCLHLRISSHHLIEAGRTVYSGCCDWTWLAAASSIPEDAS